MASIFRKDDNFVEKMSRNTYDFSFQNNMTTDFGSLRPCMCLPVQPGDSFQFKPTFGLRFLPLTFPIQTRMKASIHYFYVRNRNLWKDWPDFIGRTKTGLVPPYIHLTESNRKQIETCQLGDFLGLPTKVYDTVEYGLKDGQFLSRYVTNTASGYIQEDRETGSAWVPSVLFGKNQVGESLSNFMNWSTDSSSSTGSMTSLVVPYIKPQTLHLDLVFNSISAISDYQLLLFGSDGLCVWSSKVYNVTTDDVGSRQSIEIDVQQDWYSSEVQTLAYPNMLLALIYRREDGSALNPFPISPTVDFGTIVMEGIDVSEMPLSQLPWRSDENRTGIPLSALPFRAYESIYNSFYRNAENNPLLINGVPEYNQWCRTQEGGADTNYYPIMYHNWEDDFLTTAVPSPQQGNAPLVGLSGTPTLTIGHDDGTTTTAQLDVDDEGNVTAVNAQSGDEATTQALVEAVSYGITINDFRNVNAFQRWLENNIRRGYKYRDQIKTHYGVTVRYDELDMPEFIGGTSQPVIVNQISQTAPTDDSVLGDMAGQASAVGSGKEITHYCDEHGFIIAILCVKPVANYSQLLPKFFNVTDAFDYYFPEFGHIGMQPITYKEVTPLQANLEGKLDDVFGYQRAWYDLIGKTDEVHGLFRSDFRNFLINRTFDGSPELGKEFTVMDPNQLNEVFAVTENSDKILGQIYMDISKKTAIPLYGIPKLE